MLIALGVTGCNDDDSDSSGSANSYSAKAMDGYLQNAQMWLDLNENFELDPGEPTATSGAGGVAQFDTTGIDNPENYPVVVRAIPGETIDEDTITADNPTGTPVTTAYVMSAPAGETNVTPLSTLVHILVKQSALAGDTPEQLAEKKKQAIETVAAQLGVSQEDILGDFISGGKKDLAYVAQNIVAAKALPASTADIDKAVKESSTVSNFSKKIAAVNAFIKKKITEIKNDPTKSFESEAPLFNGQTDVSVDTDKDGVPDLFDAFPNDPKEWLDTDGDKIGDNSDPDIDGDGVLNEEDAFPLDKAESKDTDKDGVGDNADLDRDGDGVPNKQDAFPLDKTESKDTDNDGVGDNADAFPTNPAETKDTDKDGVGDNTDAFPTNPAETVDTDGDGVGNNADLSPYDKNYFVKLRTYDKKLTIVGQDSQGEGVNYQLTNGVLTGTTPGDSVWVYLPVTASKSLDQYPDVSYDANGDNGLDIFMNIYLLAKDKDVDARSNFDLAVIADKKHFKVLSYGPGESNQYLKVTIYDGESLNDILAKNSLDKSDYIVPMYHDGAGDGDYEAKGNFFLRFGDSKYTGNDEFTLNRFSFEPTYQLMEDGAKFVTSASQAGATITPDMGGNALALIHTNGDSVWMYSQIDHKQPLTDFGDFLFTAHAENDEAVSGGIFANIYVKASSVEADLKTKLVAQSSTTAPIRVTTWHDPKTGFVTYVLTLRSGQSLSSLLRDNGLNASDFDVIPYYDQPAAAVSGYEGDGDPEARGNFFVRFGDSGYTDSQDITLTRYSFSPVRKLLTDGAEFVTSAKAAGATITEPTVNGELAIQTNGDSVWAYAPIDSEQPLKDFMFTARSDTNDNSKKANAFANVYVTTNPDIDSTKQSELNNASPTPGSDIRNPGENWKLPDGRSLYIFTVYSGESLASMLHSHGFDVSDFIALPYYDAPADVEDGLGDKGDPEAKGNYFVRFGDSNYTESNNVTLTRYSFEPTYQLGDGMTFLTTAKDAKAVVSPYDRGDSSVSMTTGGDSVWAYAPIDSERPLSDFVDFTFTGTGDNGTTPYVSIYAKPSSDEAAITLKGDSVNVGTSTSSPIRRTTWGDTETGMVTYVITLQSGENLSNVLSGIDIENFTLLSFYDASAGTVEDDNDPEAKGNFFVRFGSSSYTGSGDAVELTQYEISQP